MEIKTLLARTLAALSVASGRLPGITRYPGGVGRRLRTWAFLSGNRRHVAAALLVTIYLVLLIAGTVWPFEMERLLTEESTVQQLLTTLLSGVILLVSIVVSVNALVLSEELAPVSDQHSRVVQAWAYRRESADAVDDVVSPSTPIDFLRQKIDDVDRYVELLSRQLPADDREAREELRTCIDLIETYVESVRDPLRDETLSSADMRLFADDFDPVVELDYARRLRERESLPDDSRDTLNVIIRGLEYFTSAREYFKTMYYKREFARLSRDLIYTGIPAVMLLSYLILALTGEILPGQTLGLSNIYLFFSLAYVISLSPFFVLAAYIVRGAVIAENTITAGGFVLEQ